MKQTELNKLHSFRQAIPNKIYSNERGEQYIGLPNGRLKRYEPTATSTSTITNITEINNLDVPHASTHEDGGTDEINVTDLSGELADPQKVTIHKNGTSVGTRPNINLIEGTNITLTITDDVVDDEVDITINSSVTAYTDEQAQDAVGNILTDTSTIDFTYSDATPSITADVINDSITYAKIQNVSATDKLLGRVSAGSGDVEEVTLDPDGTLAANSDDIVPTQQAVKEYVDSRTGLYATTTTDVVGTATAAEELLYAFTIAAGECVNLDTIIVRVLVTFASTSGSDKIFRIRVDTSATGVTGTIVAQFQSNNSSGNTIPLKIYQDIKCKSNGGNTLEAAYNSSGAFSQGLLAVLATPNINLASTWYIKITSDKAVVGDTMTLKYADVEIHKN